MLDLDDFATLAHGLDEAWLCDHLGVSAKTLRRWRSGATEAPKAVRHLLRFINWGELSAIGGKDWEGFTLNKQYHTLNVPLFHRPFEPRQISAMFFQVQASKYWEKEAKRLGVTGGGEVHRLFEGAGIQQVDGGVVGTDADGAIIHSLSLICAGTGAGGIPAAAATKEAVE